jgi:O-antigen/teichoic acid export membrane protein
LVHSTAGTAVTRGLGALAGIAIARLLGPGARGDVAILVVLASIASLVGAAGLQFWIIRDVARRATVTRRTVAVVMWHSVTVLAAALLAGIVLVPLLVPDVVGAAALATTVAFAATGAVAFVWLALPNGARAMGVVSFATAAASAVYLAGALVLLAVDRPSVPLVMGLATAGNLVTIAICASYVIGHREGADGPIDGVVPTWRTGLRFGAAGGAGELVLFGMLRVDFLLVAMFLPAAAVGVYAVATALTELLWVIPDGTAQIALPSAASSDADALPAVFRIALTLTAVSGVALSLLATPMLRIVFGAAYVPGARAVPFLAVAAFAGGAWKMLAADLAARHSTRDRLTSATAGLVTMVVADLVLIPAFGIAGAAAGAAVGYLVAAAIVLRVWSATTGRPTRVLIGIRTGDLDELREHRPVAMTSDGTS